MVSIITAVVAGFATTMLANLITTVYLHRSLSHRALVLASPVRGVCRALVWIATGIRPRQWVAVHRKHHAYTDVDGDPHSPVLLGWWRVQWTNVALYRRAAREPGLVAKYARDLPADRWDRWFFDRSLVGLAIGVALLIATIGPGAGLAAAVIHTSLYLATSAAVNGMGHRFGRRPYPNGAGNLQWLAFLTAGEGLHNNHHAAPTSARLSHRWFEIDFGWWAIRVLSWFRLARIRLVGRTARV